MPVLGNVTLRQLIGAIIACLLATLIATPAVSHFRSWTADLNAGNIKTATPEQPPPPLTPHPHQQSESCLFLATKLPDRVHSTDHPMYIQSVHSYWSTNAQELRPSCIVMPASVQEVALVVRLLKQQFDQSQASSTRVRFTVRSGGHSPEAGFASSEGGLVLDLSLIQSVELSQSRGFVSVGVGARWADVSSKLDGQGLAIVGGRNSDVGVGGLILGGGISFFSPRFGMVCDNIDEYEIVLANGSIAYATVTQHEDLWRALKGGTGNFGIVTRMKAKTFAAGKIWSGYIYWPSWQTRKILNAFAEFNRPENFDEFAAGPILALSYVQRLNLRVNACSLAYTRPEKWPPVFDGFRSVWRLWNTLKIQSLSDATAELSRMAPGGQRQFQATTTVLNDLETLEGMSTLYSESLKEVRGVKNLVWSLVMQPLSAAVTRKGSPNVLGLESRQANETLVVVLITVSWSDAKDDQLVNRVSRSIIDQCEELARRKGTADPFYYLNYAASGQNPIGGYGMANQHFLRLTSQRYDPDGFFQYARQGGFKVEA